MSGIVRLEDQMGHGTSSGEPQQDDVQAYIDGRLDSEGSGRIEAFMRNDREFARKIERFRTQRVGLELLGRSMNLPNRSPELEELERKLARKLVRGRNIHRGVRAMAASVVFALIVGSGWLAWNGTSGGQDEMVAFNEQTSEAYRLSATGMGDSEKARVPDWLAKQGQNMSMPAPDITALGFSLKASRIVPITGGSAIELVYEDTHGERVMLYLAANPHSRRSSFTFTSDGDLSMFYWQGGLFIYSLIGNIEQTALLQIAQLVDGELSGANAAPNMQGAGSSTVKPTAGNPSMPAKATDGAGLEAGGGRDGKAEDAGSPLGTRPPGASAGPQQEPNEAPLLVPSTGEAAPAKQI